MENKIDDEQIFLIEKIWGEEFPNHPILVEYENLSAFDDLDSIGNIEFLFITPQMNNKKKAFFNIFIDKAYKYFFNGWKYGLSFTNGFDCDDPFKYKNDRIIDTNNIEAIAHSMVLFWKQFSS